MKKVFLLLFICLWKFGQGQVSKTLRINPDDARGGNVSQIFDSVSYILLETTKESIFGDIQNLQVSKHYFVFYDYSTKGVFIFNKKGEFVGKITTAPGLGKEKWYFNNFVLNPFTEDIYLPYYATVKAKSGYVPEQRMAVFHPDGQLKQVIQLDTTLFKSIISYSLAFIDSSTAIYARDTKDSANKNYFVLIKNFKRLVKNIGPFSASDPFIGYSKDYRRLTAGSHYSFWTRMHDYTLMLMEHNQLMAYRFLFPGSISMDSTVLKDTAMMKDGNMWNEYNVNHRKLVTGLSQVFKSGRILFFTLTKGNSSMVNDSYFYNLSNGNLYNFGRITSDSSNGYLPIISVSPAAADEKYLYSTVPAYALFQAKDAGKDKHPVYPPLLKEYFATQTRKSNSAIVVLKLKPNL